MIAVAAIVNCSIAIIKAIIQKKPNKKSQKSVFSISFGSIFANIAFFSNLGSPIAYKKTLVKTNQRNTGIQASYAIIGSKPSLVFIETNSPAASMTLAPIAMFLNYQQMNAR